MNIAILILNWNGVQLLKEFLPSVVNYSGDDANIYVVDNASSDESLAYVEAEFPGVKIISFTENHGYAKGYNLALEQIDEEFAILLNNDVAFTENVVPAFLDLFENKKNIAAIQPKILDYKNPTYFEYAGAGGGYIDWFAYPFCRGRIFEKIEEDQGQYNDEVPVFWASGACIALRVAAFKKVGGFDKDYFAHMEEIDLCWRLQNAGYKVFYTGKTVVYHLGGGTLSHLSPEKTFLNFRNSLFNLLKNAPSRNIYAKIIARMLLDGVGAFYFLAKLQPAHFMAVLKAHFSFYRHFSTMKKKRKIPVHTRKYYQLFSIVWKSKF